ncbi:MAG TPA: hypothetical protein P5527_02165 [Kiritimatiellia bacterium]|jgi:uncharacterized repeat protein (TIGR04138 family)|nr:hypothetical protein [Kiritimatiellia bacterium]
MNPSFQETVRDICKKDTRYHPDAYEFIVEALDVTVKKLNRCQSGHPRHVTGQELLEGIKEFALDEFGPLAFTVFSEWGIHTTEDFGEIVFNLVDAGRLGKTESDSRDDFKRVYDFNDVFVKPYEPRATTPAPRSSARRRKREA